MPWRECRSGRGATPGEAQPAWAAVASTEDVLEKDGNLSIPRYVRTGNGAVDGGGQDLKTEWASFATGGRAFWLQMDALVDMLDGLVAEEAGDG